MVPWRGLHHGVRGRIRDQELATWVRALRDDDHVLLAHRHLNEHPLSGMQFGRHRDEHILRRHLRLLLHRWLWYVTRSWHTVLQLLLLHLWLCSGEPSCFGGGSERESAEHRVSGWCPAFVEGG